MNAKEYWAEYVKTAGLPEDLVKAGDALLSNEKVMNAFVPRPEFSRTLDAKDKEVQAANNARLQYEAEVKDYYKKEAEKAAERQRVFDENMAMTQRYRDLYGELPGDPTHQRQTVTTPAFDSSQYISKKEYDESLKRIEGQSLYVIKEGLKASQDYFAKFGKPLDIDALEKFAVEKGLPLNLAYSQMIQPELEAKQSSSFAEQLKRAREEGATEALSRVKSPIDPRPVEPSPFLSNVLKPADKAAGTQSVSDRLASFAAAYTDPGGAPQR
jgi:hypothetical protein